MASSKVPSATCESMSGAPRVRGALRRGGAAGLAPLDSLNALGIERGAISGVRVHEQRAPGARRSAYDVWAPLELALLDSLNALGIERGAISGVRVHERRAHGCAGALRPLTPRTPQGCRRPVAFRAHRHMTSRSRSVVRVEGGRSSAAPAGRAGTTTGRPWRGAQQPGRRLRTRVGVAQDRPGHRGEGRDALGHPGVAAHPGGWRRPTYPGGPASVQPGSSSTWARLLRAYAVAPLYGPSRYSGSSP